MNKHCTIILLALLIAGNPMAQGIVDLSFVDSFEVYRNQSLQEKLYVHTDKKLYLAGEICWFKVYVVDGSFHQPLNLEKIVYVEILTDENRPVLQAMIALQDAMGSGSFVIPNSFVTGTYTLRAYTNWMKNGSADFFFQKRLNIINPLKKAVPQPSDDTHSTTVQFFPEGGNLVYGISNVLAVKVTAETGKGLDASGVIVNQNNETIARFKTLQFGMGQFTFTPLPGHTYKAIIHISPGNKLEANIPPILEKGWVLHLQNINKQQVKVTATSNKTATDGKCFLFVHTRLSIKKTLSAVLQNGKAEWIINKELLGDGISQFTLFDEQQQPVCERLYFKRPDKRLQINTPLHDAVYGKRKKVLLDINTEDNGSNKVAANLSAAVVLVDELQPPETEDILSYLWLRADLKGYVENAMYYFNDSSATAAEAAENLMLTQGWRRFTWTKILQKTQQEPASLPETDGHIVEGTVFEKNTMSASGNIMTYATIPGKPFALQAAVADKNGKFYLNMPLFYGSNDMILQPANHATGDYHISIRNPFSEKYSMPPPRSFKPVEQWASALSKRNIGTQVQQLYTSEKINRFYNNNSDSTNFYGSFATTYYLDDYTRFITMEEVLREYVNEVRLRKSRDQYQLFVNSLTESELENKPLVLLDGMPVSDINQLIALDPLKIRKIDIVQQPYQYGPLHADGIISFGSYNGDLAGFTLNPSALLIEYAGLQLQREFYQPNYDDADPLNSRLPDFRNTLLWNPFLKTNKNGEQQLSFFTGDIAGKYAVIIQGITKDAVAGSMIQYITVQ